MRHFTFCRCVTISQSQIIICLFVIIVMVLIHQDKTSLVWVIIQNNRIIQRLFFIEANGRFCISRISSRRIIKIQWINQVIAFFNSSDTNHRSFIGKRINRNFSPTAHKVYFQITCIQVTQLHTYTFSFQSYPGICK